tara:strand:+ start:429 stop:875 length:447 start_codon:yes stop_codon:yes gene_type:complete
MPKRFLSLYDDKSNDDDIESIYNILTEEDYLSNSKTLDILMDEHYTTFLLKLEDSINITCDNFKNNNKTHTFLNKDEFGYYYMDILDIIYKYIEKQYDISIFEFQDKLLYDIFYEEEKKELIKTKKVNIKNNIKNNNVFDWNTKTYKK